MCIWRRYSRTGKEKTCSRVCTKLGSPPMLGWGGRVSASSGPKTTQWGAQWEILPQGTYLPAPSAGALVTNSWAYSVPSGAWGKWAGWWGARGCVSGGLGDGVPTSLPRGLSPGLGLPGRDAHLLFHGKPDTGFKLHTLKFLNTHTAVSVRVRSRLKHGQMWPVGEDGLRHNCYLPVYSRDHYSAFMTLWIKNKTFFKHISFDFCSRQILWRKGQKCCFS